MPDAAVWLMFGARCGVGVGGGGNGVGGGGNGVGGGGVLVKGGWVCPGCGPLQPGPIGKGPPVIGVIPFNSLGCPKLGSEYKEAGSTLPIPGLPLLACAVITPLAPPLAMLKLPFVKIL
jgi:hypothetical protein